MYIVFKVVGDVLDDVYPSPLAAVFGLAEKEGEWLRIIPQCVALHLDLLQLSLQINHRLHGLHQISVSSTLHDLGMGKFFTRLFGYIFFSVMLGPQSLVKLLYFALQPSGFHQFICHEG